MSAFVEIYYLLGNINSYSNFECAVCMLDVLGVTCASCRVSVAGSLTAAVVDGPVSPSGGAGVLLSDTFVGCRELVYHCLSHILITR